MFKYTEQIRLASTQSSTDTGLSLTPQKHDVSDVCKIIRAYKHVDSVGKCINVQCIFFINFNPKLLAPNQRHFMQLCITETNRHLLQS